MLKQRNARLCKVSADLKRALSEFNNDIARLSVEVASYGNKPLVVPSRVEQAIPDSPEKISYGTLFSLMVGHLDSVHCADADTNEADRVLVVLLNKSDRLYPQHWFDDAELTLVKEDDYGTQPYLALVRSDKPLYHIPENIEHWDVKPTALLENDEVEDDPNDQSPALPLDEHSDIDANDTYPNGNEPVKAIVEDVVQEKVEVETKVPEKVENPSKPDVADTPASSESTSTDTNND